MYIHLILYLSCFFVNAVSLTGQLIGAGSGRVYSGRYWQPLRLAQNSLYIETQQKCIRPRRALQARPAATRLAGADPRPHAPLDGDDADLLGMHKIGNGA